MTSQRIWLEYLNTYSYITVTKLAGATFFNKGPCSRLYRLRVKLSTNVFFKKRLYLAN